MKVEEKGTISIKTTRDNVKLVHDLQYVPNLFHNLVSVGQLMNAGYSLLFDDVALFMIRTQGKTLSTFL